MKRNLFVGSTLLALLIALGIGQSVLVKKTEAQAKGNNVMVPRFEVDPTFPKPMPNHWYQGMSIGVGVDANDHVWIVHRPDTVNANEAAEDAKTGSCCAKAPPILEFDPAGHPAPPLGRRGRRGLQVALIEPRHHHRLQGQRVDRRQRRRRRHGAEVHPGRQVPDDGRQQGRADRQQQHGALRDGRQDLRRQEGERGLHLRRLRQQARRRHRRRHRQVQAVLGRVRQQAGRHEHRPLQPGRAGRPAVPHTGALRRGVGRSPRLRLRPRERSHPGVHDRRQVRQGRRGSSKRTLGDGSTWDIAFSNDPQQKFIYLADGKDERVWILDRNTLEILSSFGDGGKQPGQFYAVHSIATDSKGNIYTTETYDGRRLQRFLYKGMQSVPKGEDQGTVWPKTATQ